MVKRRKKESKTGKMKKKGQKYLKWMEFTQFVITYYKERTPVDIDMLLYIKEKTIS